MVDIKTKLIHWLGGYTKDELVKHCDSVPVMSCMFRARLKKL